MRLYRFTLAILTWPTRESGHNAKWFLRPEDVLMPTFFETISDIRTIVGALVSLVVAAFIAGLTYNSLLNRIETIEKDMKQMQGEVKNTQSQLNDLKGKLTQWNSIEAIGEEKTASKCPMGMYAVGFAFQSQAAAAPSPHEALWAGHIVCRPLNVPGN
jgi:hypothetical protein